MDAPPPPEQFDLRYDLTPEDFLPFCMWYVHESGQAREALRKGKRIRAFYVGLASAATLSAFWMLQLEWSGPYSEAVPLLLGAGCVLTWIAAHSTVKACSREARDAHARASVRHPASTYHQGPTHLVADDEGFVVTRERERVHQFWSGISRVDRAGELLLLHRPDLRVFIVPRRAFANGETADRFFSFAERACARAEDSDARVLERFFAAGDPTCPKCGYSLMGVRSIVCPECSYPLDRNTLPAAWQPPARRA